MGQRYTGLVKADCPTCGQSIASDSVPGSNLAKVRKVMKKIAESFRKAYPFAKIKTADPLQDVGGGKW